MRDLENFIQKIREVYQSSNLTDKEIEENIKYIIEKREQIKK